MSLRLKCKMSRVLFSSIWKICYKKIWFEHSNLSNSALTYLCVSETKSVGISIWGSESDFTPLFSLLWNNPATFINRFAFIHSSEAAPTLGQMLGTSWSLLKSSTVKCFSSCPTVIEHVRSWSRLRSLKLLSGIDWCSSSVGSEVSSMISDSPELRLCSSFASIINSSEFKVSTIINSS